MVGTTIGLSQPKPVNVSAKVPFASRSVPETARYTISSPVSTLLLDRLQLKSQ
jgi:hypothetical protein